MSVEQNEHNTQSQQIKAFFERLYPDNEGFIEFRPIPDGKRGRPANERKWYPSLEAFLEALPMLIEFCRRRGLAAYYGILPRAKDGKAKKEDILPGCVLWADLDVKDYSSWEELDAKVDGLENKPHAIIASGGGYHLYYFLDGIYTTAEIEEANQRLAQSIGGAKCHNCDRILRIPGSWHQKDKKNPKLVTIVHLDKNGAYTLEELEKSWPEMDMFKGKKTRSTKEPGEKKSISSFALNGQIESLKLRARISTRFSQLMQNNEKLWHLYNDFGKPPGTDQSGSGYDYSFTHEALWLDADLKDTADALTKKVKKRKGGLTRKDEKFIKRTLQNCLKSMERIKSNKVIQLPTAAKKGLSEISIDQVRSQLQAYPDDHLPKHLRGQFQKSLENLQIIMEHDPRWKDSFQYNAFTHKFDVDGRPANDHDITALRIYIAKHYGLEYGKETIQDLYKYTAHQNQYHPVRDHLKKCHRYWKQLGKPSNLKECLIKYGGAEETDLTRAITKCFFIGSVRRIMEPGTELHSVLWLIGKQGVGKSSLLKALVPDKEWFRDTPINLKAGRDAYAMLRGVWIYEWAEAVSIQGESDEIQKAFISSPTDHFRPAYGHFEESFPRQVTIAMTGNNYTCLTDQENRRYHTIETGNDIDIKSLKKVVPLLWGEAYQMYLDNENHWLSSEMEKELKKTQERYQALDTWTIKIREQTKPSHETKGMTSKDILLSWFNIPIERQRKSYQMRLAKALQQGGWRKRRVKGKGEKREWMWFYESQG